MAKYFGLLLIVSLLLLGACSAAGTASSTAGAEKNTSPQALLPGAALDAGLAEAEKLRRAGLIAATALFLGDDARVSGMPAESLVSPADMQSVAA